MERLAKKNLTPVIVPDDDKDHQGSVHDKDDEDKVVAFPLDRFQAADDDRAPV